MSIIKVQYVISVHLRIVKCHQIKKKWRYSQNWRKFFPWSGETHHGKISTDEEVEKLKAESNSSKALGSMTMTVCKTSLLERQSLFFRGCWALIKPTGKTLNQLSCVSWVDLHGCFLIMSVAFSTFSEDWGLQEQCDILFLELLTPLEL